MLAHLFDIQPNAAKFCMVLKKYLKRLEVKLKNYAVVLLAIFYLQQRDFLPTIKAVQQGLKPVKIDGKIKSQLEKYTTHEY